MASPTGNTAGSSGLATSTVEAAVPSLPNDTAGACGPLHRLLRASSRFWHSSTEPRAELAPVAPALWLGLQTSAVGRTPTPDRATTPTASCTGGILFVKHYPCGLIG